jgi:hypothetical protein
MALRECGAIISMVASSMLFAATPTRPVPPVGLPQPIEVKVVSMPSPPTAQQSEVKITSMPTPQKTELSVTDIPTDPWNKGLVFLTAFLVLANFALCAITIGISKSQRKDTADSMRVAERMANAAEISAEANRESQRSAARDRRVALEREVSVSAHRLAVQATLVQNMVDELRNLLRTNFAFAGQSPATSSRAKMYDDVQQERTQEIARISSTANQIAGLILGGKSEHDLTEHLKTIDATAAGIEALKEQVRDDLGASRAFSERQQRRQEEIATRMTRPPGA